MPRPLFVPTALAASAVISAGLASAQVQPMSPAEFRAALAHAEIVGPADQPELIIPIDTPAWANAIGVTGTFRHYKGLCGPDGAVASIDQLVAHAQRDLTGVSVRGIDLPFTQVVGDSPTIKVTYDLLNIFAVFYLGDFVEAAQYIDSQFQNRVTINVTMDAESIPGSTIGSAGSTRYSIPWSSYVEGLRHQSNREDDDFADALPFNSLPVRFGFPGTGTTNVTNIRVTDAQIRAVFGDNVVDEDQSVSITLDTDNSWSLGGCANSPSGSQLSLIDVAVHEITHSLGFTSSIDTEGVNDGNTIQGLDVARFLEDFLFAAIPGISGGRPVNNDQFTTFPRHGEGSIISAFSLHWYSNNPDGFATFLEQGDTNQPSHLARFDAFEDKLGIMDPTLIAGTTFCSSFYSNNDLKPLDDMGWYPVAANVLGDCNGNGLLDIFDIANGAPDTNQNNIPDSCEPFFADVSLGSSVTGLTLAQWNAPGLTTLDGFNPNNFTLVFRGATDDATTSYTSSADIVARFSGHFNAPTTGQYAFRVGHSDAATLRVAGQTLLAINAGRSVSPGGLAPQNFINLDAGLHAFELTVILNNSGDSATVQADAIALGDWRALVQNDFRRALSSFPDCDGNGVDDQFDADSDNDGIPDDCEADCDNDGIPDETQFAGDLAAVTPMGVIASPGVPVILSTDFSNFDTEIALYDSNGVLIQVDDDSGPGTTSQIVRTLDVGTYRLGVGGFNISFANGPTISFPFGCNQSGAAFVTATGSSSVFSTSFLLPSGRTRWFEFSIADDCDNDGRPDSQEQDCDGNGTPDECEDLGSVADAIDLGQVADAGLININTVGSSFDTEIGLWDFAGALIRSNDDAVGLQSQLIENLPAGVYFVSVSGFDTLFGGNFSADTLASAGCEAGGTYRLSIDGASVATGTLPSERVQFFMFEVTPPAPCNVADLAEPFGLLDLSDVSAFAGAFIGGNLLADIDGNTLLDLTDISLFVSAFTGGCP